MKLIDLILSLALIAVVAVPMLQRRRARKEAKPATSESPPQATTIVSLHAAARLRRRPF